MDGVFPAPAEEIRLSSSHPHKVSTMNLHSIHSTGESLLSLQQKVFFYLTMQDDWGYIPILLIPPSVSHRFEGNPYRNAVLILYKKYNSGSFFTPLFLLLILLNYVL